MKTASKAGKKPFGKGKFSRVKNVRYLSWEDAFDVEFEDGQIIVGEGLTAIKKGSSYLPFLSDSVTLAKFPSVMVDMGAVKFMCNGANVMRPGIRSFGDFEKGQIVCIQEESQKKSLAVGRTLVSSEEMKQMDKGIVIENLHYISDKYWEAKKSIKE